MSEKIVEKMAKEAGIWGAYMGETEHLERFCELAQADFKNRLAQAIEQMPFGDTATSFATFVRNFK